METVGSIQVVATINTSGYDSGKQKIESGNKSLEKNADSTSKNFASAWTGAIAGFTASITNKLASSVTNLIGDMTDMYDATVKFPKVLTTMGATGDFASQAFKDMKKYADATVYSLEDMTGTFGTLYGITGSKTGGIVSALGGVSALAADASKAMNSWSIQVTQMVSKPTVAWVDFRILLEQNPAAIAKIAQAMGKTSGQLVSDVNAGTVATDDFLKKLEEVGNSQSLQKMATSSDNFKNSIGQMQASVVSAGAKILDSFGTSAIDIINGASKSIDDLSISMTKLIDYIKNNKDVFSTLAVSIGAASGAILLYNTYIKVAAILTAIQNAVVVLYSVYTGALAAGLTATTAAQIALNTAFKANPIGLIISAIVALIAGLIYFFTQTESGKKIWSNFMSFLGTAVKTISGFFKGLWKNIANTWNGVTKFFSDIIGGIVQVFKNLFDFFTGGDITLAKENLSAPFIAWVKILNKIRDSVVGVFTSIINWIVKAFNSVVGFFKEWGLTILAVMYWPFSLALGFIIDNWSTITSFFKMIWDGIVAIFTPVIQFFLGMFSGAWEIIKAIWGAVVSYFSFLWSGIVAVFSVVGDFFRGIFSGAWEIIKVVWSVVVGYFSFLWWSITVVFSVVGKFFKDIFTIAWNAITGVFSAVGGFFKGVWDTIVKTFTSIGTAIGNAIGGAFKSVINTILTYAVGFINGFIKEINGAINLINKIPGVKIGKIGMLPVPQLATGGIATGPTLAMIGEGKEPEAVVPLSKLNAMLNGQSDYGNSPKGVTINQTNNISTELDMDVVNRNLSWQLRRA